MRRSYPIRLMLSAVPAALGMIVVVFLLLFGLVGAEIHRVGHAIAHAEAIEDSLDRAGHPEGPHIDGEDETSQGPPCLLSDRPIAGVASAGQQESERIATRDTLLASSHSRGQERPAHQDARGPPGVV